MNQSIQKETIERLAQEAVLLPISALPSRLSDEQLEVLLPYLAQLIEMGFSHAKALGLTGTTRYSGREVLEFLDQKTEGAVMTISREVRAKLKLHSTAHKSLLLLAGIVIETMLAKAANVEVYFQEWKRRKGWQYRRRTFPGEQLHTNPNQPPSTFRTTLRREGQGIVTRVPE